MIERALREWVFRQARKDIAAPRGDALLPVKTVPETRFGVADVELIGLVRPAHLVKSSGLSEGLARRMRVRHRRGCQDNPIPLPRFYSWCIGRWQLSKIGALKTRAQVPAGAEPLLLNRILDTAGRLWPRARGFWEPTAGTDRRVDCRTEWADALEGIDRVLCSLDSKQSSG